jgi:putative transposase
MVWSTKYRRPVLIGEIAKRCEQVIRSVAKDMDIRVIRMAVNPEHVHLFIKYPPKYSTSHMALKFKGISSRVLRQEFPELKEFSKKFLWAPSCYHGSVGQGMHVVENYIKCQDDHHEKDYEKYMKKKDKKDKKGGDGR